MRIAVTVLIISFCQMVLNAQSIVENNFPTKDGKIYYQEVVNVDTNLEAESLYLNAKTWIAESFKSSKAVIEADDKDAMLIIIKSFVVKGHNAMVSNPKNWYNLKLEIKDGRYRYTLSDIYYEFDINYMGQSSHHNEQFENWIQPSDKPMPEKKREKLIEGLNSHCKAIDSEFRNIIESLKSGMSKKPNDTW